MGGGIGTVAVLRGVVLRGTTVYRCLMQRTLWHMDRFHFVYSAVV